MCEELAELRRAVVRYTSGFDPEAITCADAARVVSEAKQIASATETLLAHAAARAAQSSSWNTSGHRAAAQALAHETGTSVSSARKRCPARARLERDHRVDWSKTHFTMFDLLDLLYSHHHDLKTKDDWQLVERRGKRPFVPPGDPGHPRHKKRPAEDPATGPPKRAA